MARKIAAMKACKRRWMPAGAARGARLLLHKLHYHDELLWDMGLNPKRKTSWLAPLKEAIFPYQPSDYRTVVAGEWQARDGRADNRGEWAARSYPRAEADMKVAMGVKVRALLYHERAYRHPGTEQRWWTIIRSEPLHRGCTYLVRIVSVSGWATIGR